VRAWKGPWYESTCTERDERETMDMKGGSKNGKHRGRKFEGEHSCS